MDAIDALAQDLGSLAVFAGLSGKELRLMARASVVRNFNAGEIVFLEGDEVSSLLVLLTGEVKTFMRSPDGREQIITHLRRGDVISVPSLLLEENACHPASGKASQPTQIVSIALSFFRELTAPGAESAFVRALLQSLAAQNAQLSLLAGSLSLQSARSRLAAFLIKQADQPVLQGGITQEEIAAEIGTVREIVARQLRDFAQAGWLERRRQRLVLKNRAALEEEARRW